jgi:hypothetical protein
MGPCCERQLLSTKKPETLAALEPDEIQLEGLLKDRVSPVKVVLLIGAYLFFMMPVFGPIFLLLAWLPSGSSRPLFRMACRICLFLHLIAVNALAFTLIMDQKK